MTREQKTAMARIISDMIKADIIIEESEIKDMKKLMSEYAIIPLTYSGQYKSERNGNMYVIRFNKSKVFVRVHTHNCGCEYEEIPIVKYDKNWVPKPSVTLQLQLHYFAIFA